MVRARVLGRRGRRGREGGSICRSARKARRARYCAMDDAWEGLRGCVEGGGRIPGADQASVCRGGLVGARVAGAGRTTARTEGIADGGGTHWSVGRKV